MTLRHFAPFILLAAIFLWPEGTISGQNRVDILQSDVAQSVQTGDGLIRKLRGNVILRTNEVRMEADSAWHYVDKREIHGFGNLRVETSSELIWADRLIYYIDDEVSSLSGRVIIENNTVTIFSETALYSFLTEIALFRSPIWMQDEDGILRADEGIYFNQADSAVFRGRVQLADSTQYIEADSMFVNRSAKTYQLHGQVYLQDDENNTRLTGDYVEADSTGRRLIRGNAVLQRIRESQSDTTWMRADHILVTKQDSINITDAIGNVQIWDPAYATASDSLHYNEALEQFTLRGAPNVWYERIQLKGRVLVIDLKDDTVQQLTASGEPFAAQQDSITLRIHQMLGDTLIVHFTDDAVSRIDVLFNAELLLHYSDENDNPDGALNLRSGSIISDFEDGEVSDMTALDGIEGQAFEESDDLINRQLDRYTWSPESRPVRPTQQLMPQRPPIPLTPPFMRTNVVIGQKRGSAP